VTGWLSENELDFSQHECSNVLFLRDATFSAYTPTHYLTKEMADLLIKTKMFSKFVQTDRFI